MNLRRYLALALALAVVVGGMRLFGKSDALRESARGDDPRIAELRDFDEFALFYAGKSVLGQPLETVLHSPGERNSVTFIYGTCERPGAGESSCVSLQVWSVCTRRPSMDGPGMPTVDPATVRGAPASTFEGGRRLELQTADSTIVISADDPLPVVEALRGVNNDVKTGEPLPEPVVVEPAECRGEPTTR